MSAVILSDRSVMVEGGELVFTESDIVETLTSAYEDSLVLGAEDVLEIEELVASLFDALEEKNLEDDNMGLCDLPDLESVCSECYDNVVEGRNTVDGELARLANFLQEQIDPVGTAIRRLEYQHSDLEDELALSKTLLDQIDEIEVYVRNASVKTPAPGETLLQSVASLIADSDAGYVRLLTVNRVLNEEIKELNAVVKKLRDASQPTTPFLNPIYTYHTQPSYPGYFGENGYLSLPLENIGIGRQGDTQNSDVTSAPITSGFIAPASDKVYGPARAERPTYPASFTVLDKVPIPFPVPKVGPAIPRHNLSSIPCGKDCIQCRNAA